MRIEKFDYELPPAAIAQLPADPRDASRLLVMGEPIIDTTFGKLGDYLTADDLLVRNGTRVRAARLRGTRPTGGAIELLLLASEGDEWTALAKPARKLRKGTTLDFDRLQAVVTEVMGEGRVRIRLQALAGVGSIEDIIAAVGTIPYPPYVRSGPADPERYQTVYGFDVGSTAAPTAGLHFTAPLLQQLVDRGVRSADVLLDIGLDTFRPITTSTVEGHVIHRERYAVPEATAAAISATRARGGRVVAVGTTVVRALESAQASGNPSGWTELFIRPGYQLRVVDAVITNFHMPRSSLLVMVAAMVPEWRRIYSHALDHGYRFLSFGDAMFVPEAR